jgi:hypothetical protein
VIVWAVVRLEEPNTGSGTLYLHRYFSMGWYGDEAIHPRFGGYNHWRDTRLLARSKRIDIA